LNIFFNDDPLGKKCHFVFLITSISLVILLIYLEEDSLRIIFGEYGLTYMKSADFLEMIAIDRESYCLWE